jgi:small GTP-binding protein
MKVVFIGESTVGKTSIIDVAGSGTFDGRTVPTVAGTYVALTYLISEITVRLTIWDTAGQERYRSIAPLYYRDADICCIVYAIDSHHSFEAVNDWHLGVKRELERLPKIYLLGNKTDLEDQREVSKLEGKEKANAIGATFFETSAKFESSGIIAMFQHMAQDVVESASTATSCRSVLQHTEPEDACC